MTQQKNALQAADSTAQVTFTTVYNDFKQGVEAVGEALKVGAEHVYEVLVKQQVINSITWLSIVLLFAIVSIVLLQKGTKDMFQNFPETRSSIPKTEVKDSKFVLIIIGAILSIATLAVLVVQAGTIITGFLNPEYGAMMEIKEMIK